MAIEVFNRYENKYKVNSATYKNLINRISDHMDTDVYNQNQATYRICNLYYDTPDHYLIRNSLQKPKYKEKLRVRSYGTPNCDSKVYVEIKKKFCGIVNKRRSSLRLEDAYEFLETKNLPDHATGANAQVISEIRWFLEQYDLSPKIYLSYDRRAYFDRDNSDLRISFDTNIITRRFDLKLENGSYGASLLPDDIWLMEIKTEKALPIWLVTLLSEFQVYPDSFSKYGAEYKKFVEREQKNRVAVQNKNVWERFDYLEYNVFNSPAVSV